MDEATLLDKLRKIEALHAGATTDGERDAARAASERIRARLEAWRAREHDLEMHYSIHDPWERMLFSALCRRYGLKPFRYARQRATTVVVAAPEPFHKNTLWPEFRSLAAALREHLRDVTERVIHVAIHDNASEPEERAAPSQLPPGT